MGTPASGGSVRLVSAVMLAASIAAASAQDRPFHDEPVAITAAFAVERTLARVTAVAAGPSADAGAAAEAASTAVADDLPLFRASLARHAGTLDDALATALRSLQGTGAGPAEVAHARDLAGRAAQALAADLPGPPARATVLTLLLTGPDGLADSFQEAAGSGDRLAQATAWAMLQRGEVLWRQLAATTSNAQRQEAAAAFARLGTLVPSPASGERPAPGSPDDVETESNQVVAILEAALHASLAPDRDLPGLAALVRDLASRGCAAADAAGDQRLAAGATLYKGYLSSTVAILAPGDDLAVHEAFTSLSRGSSSRAGTCSALERALRRVTATLGG